MAAHVLLFRWLSLHVLTSPHLSPILSLFKEVSALRLVGLTPFFQVAVECVLVESNSASLSQPQAELAISCSR